jgi:hypothetical protein
LPPRARPRPDGNFPLTMKMILFDSHEKMANRVAHLMLNERRVPVGVGLSATGEAPWSPQGQLALTVGSRRFLAADVAGYSRLIEADEEGTLGQLKALRAEIIDSRIAKHHGRIVKTTCDGLLVEFSSVVDALRCAAEVQAAMAEANAASPPDRRIEFRPCMSCFSPRQRKSRRRCVCSNGRSSAIRVTGRRSPGPRSAVSGYG